MLKRQRPTTPPASLVSIPSPSEFAAPDQYSLFPHVAKRRRIVAPVLDGRERGLQLDDEGLLEDEEDEDCDTTDSTTIAPDDISISHWSQQATQYKHTNAMLHQLHLESQRRTQLAPSQAHASNRSPHNDDDSPSFPGQLGKFPRIGSPVRSPKELGSSTPIDSPRNVNAGEEQHQVRERYEEQNRLLGSLVRRRKEEQGL